MANELTLLSVGDASIDTFITPIESESLCQLDSKECLICFNYGDKIPVKDQEISVGGNAANNAVGVSRLGINSAIVLTVGEDSIAGQIVDTLQKEKINTNFISKETNGKSNSSIVVSYSGERTIFVYHAPRNYQFPNNLPVTPWLYLTSMGEGFESFYISVHDFLSQNPSTKLVFNPGSWQLRNLDRIQNIFPLTYLLFVNKEEAKKITGLPASAGDEKGLLNALSNLGVKIPIITDGQNGCFALENGKYLKLGILPIDAIERTGAGDAFGSGTLAALIKGKTLEEALVWGMVNSTSVISFVGSQKGLLHDSEIPSWLEKVRAGNIKVESF